MIESLGLVPFLLSDSAVKAIIGDGISPMATAQGKPFPRLTYQRITTQRTRSNDGPTGLVQARIQLDGWGEGPGGYDKVKALMEAVRKARGSGSQASPVDDDHAQLDGFKGRMGTVNVQGAFLDDDQDLSEEPLFADDKRIARVSADLTIWFEESLS